MVGAVQWPMEQWKASSGRIGTVTQGRTVHERKGKEGDSQNKITCEV
jgi:hypothetical protein